MISACTDLSLLPTVIINNKIPKGVKNRLTITNDINDGKPQKIRRIRHDGLICETDK